MNEWKNKIFGKNKWMKNNKISYKSYICYTLKVAPMIEGLTIVIGIFPLYLFIIFSQSDLVKV